MTELIITVIDKGGMHHVSKPKFLFGSMEEVQDDILDQKIPEVGFFMMVTKYDDVIAIPYKNIDEIRFELVEGEKPLGGNLKEGGKGKEGVNKE